MDGTTDTGHQHIDNLLSELRVAGPKPGDELLNAIRASGAEGVPALTAMVTNPAEYEVVEGDEDRTGWAPYSVVDILGELHPPEALEPLLSLLPWDGYEYLTSSLPVALAQYGEGALDPLTAFLADESQIVWSRWRAITAMAKMAGIFPELRDEIAARLMRQLDTVEPNDENLEVLRGALISELVELRATESIPSIIRAFEETDIDPFLTSWSDVRDAFDIPPGIAPHLDHSAPSRQAIIDSILGSGAPQPMSDPALVAPKSYRRQTLKVGRNEPCPCGSGKKYKKCHGR